MSLMLYLYHRVPDNMQGSVLYPLNVLKEKFPEAYSAHARKYKGREAVMESVIPPLRCLWNDVLHFTAVHPREVLAALRQFGNYDGKFDYYRIAAASIEPDKAVVYLYPPDAVGREKHQEDFVPYKVEELEKFAALPEAAVAYYKERLSHGSRPLMYHLIPHILYRGTIDVSDAEVISV